MKLHTKSPGISSFLNTHRIWVEIVALMLVLVGLTLTISELSVAQRLREAQLIAMASEMVLDHRSEVLSEREEETDTAPRGRVASAARAVLERAAAENVSLAGFTASYTNLLAANLPGVDFRGGNFRRVYLVGANLSRANFGTYPAPTAYQAERSDLRTDLRLADLSGANLSNADLSRADLSSAVLSHSDLKMADFNGTILNGTVFSGADLLDAKNLSQAQLNDACGENYKNLKRGLEIAPCQKSEETQESKKALSARVSVDRSTDLPTGTRYIDGSSYVVGEDYDANRNPAPHELQFERDTTYRIIGVCDPDCLDFDLALYDPRGKEVAGDYALDDVPILIYTPKESGMFRLQVMMVTCSLVLRNT